MAKSAFEAGVNRHLDAIRGRDLAEFAATTADDVRLVGTNGRLTEGRTPAVEAHRQWFADQGWSIDFVPEFFELRENVGWCLVHARYQAGGETSNFMLFMLFGLEDQTWKLTYDQGTALKASDV